MVRWLILAAVAALIALFLIVPSGRYYIEANPITTPSPGFVSGGFTIKRSYLVGFKPGWPFVTFPGHRTQGTGGACIAANARDLGLTEFAGKHCASSNDCKSTARPDWSGYCDVSDGQCWFRPGPGKPADAISAPFCNRSLDHPQPDGSPTPWLAEIRHPANRTPLLLATMPVATPVRWRVIACLNIAGSDGVDTGGCGKTDGTPRQMAFGPVSAPLKP